MQHQGAREPDESGRPVIVVNLWFAKHSNGLFHYGLDYAEALAPGVREIWVRNKTLAGIIGRRMPGIRIRVPSLSGLLRAAAGAVLRRDTMFTPTSHPIPFLPGQIVVVHDSFPFAGRAGRSKRWLFRIAALSAGVTAGYINRSDAKPFLETCGLSTRRLRYLPNRIGAPASRRTDTAVVGERLVVGLFGTDSPKKAYDQLFAAVVASQWAMPVEWRIFGHDNEYTGALCERFAGCPIRIIASDTCTMEDFIRSIDVAVSVATGEGFARPVALALMNGVPTMLLATPVFEEFYRGSAQMFPSVTALVYRLAAIRAGDRLERPVLATEQALRADFARGITGLQEAARTSLRGAGDDRARGRP